MSECALCGCTTKLTEHHLIPKKVHKRYPFKHEDKDHLMTTIPICRPCHNHLHKCYDHRELGELYSTVEKIMEAPKLLGFFEWRHKRMKRFG